MGAFKLDLGRKSLKPQMKSIVCQGITSQREFRVIGSCVGLAARKRVGVQLHSASAHEAGPA